MKNLLIAMTIALGTATAAHAGGALDAYVPQQGNATGIDYTATASVGETNADVIDLDRRLGDGSPAVEASNGSVDLTATASIGGSVDAFDGQARLGDGSPAIN